MIFKVRLIPVKMNEFYGFANEEDLKEIGIIHGDRLKLVKGSRSITIFPQPSQIVARGEIGIPINIAEELKVEDGEEIKAFPISRPKSVEYIRKKLSGKKLSKDEIYEIIEDIVNNSLSEVELTAFVISNYLVGMDFDEIEWMTRAMIETGETISFEKGIVVDKHSIGGVPGNKISLIIVPTVASAGLLIPKTASRAITSASGTADTMEVLANVNLSVEEIKEITERVGGVIAWGGATNIAPADDKIIRVEYPLSLDPKPQLLASVMAKKGAVGARHVVIDIPVGEGAKISDMKRGRELSSDFVELGRRLGLNVTCAITYGGQPIGRAVGPALEAKEALKAMEERKGSSSLLEKSFGIAGILFEMAGIAMNGYEYAKELFMKGKTHEKFLEIVEAQGGEIRRSEEIMVGENTHTFTAAFEGAVVAVRNKAIVKIARSAGAPKDKGAGIVVHKKKGEVVKKGDPLFTIYAEKDWKLQNAVETARGDFPIIVSGMILDRYPSFKVM